MSALFATPLASHQNHPNHTYPIQQRPASKQHRQQLQLQQLQQLQQQQQQQPVFPSPPPSLYNDENIATTLAIQSLVPLATDQPQFDFAQDYTTASPSLIPADPANSAWLSSGQLTPTSSSRAHHRAGSLSSLGSVGPASPFAGNTSNPQVAGDLYHDYQSMASTYLPHEQHNKHQPLTPEHTPLQEQFLSPNYAFYNASAPPPQHSNLKRVAGDETAAERQKIAYRSAMPKLDRTMSDAYRDELYNPNLQFTTAAPSTQVLAAAMPQNDVFAQRLQAANTQHLSASHRTSLSAPSRERSPFRQGSPLAPASNAFARQQPNVMFGTASHLREQQKAENARAMQEQFERSPEHVAPKTISPKDVDLVYHETEADAKTPLFSQPPQPATDLDDAASQQSFGSMATSRRESLSAYSGSSHATQQAPFNFAPPAVAGSVRPLPQQYPFTNHPSRKPSEVSNHTEEFPATIASMESSSSEYTPDTSRKRRAAADTGTYTCTYHGCTLRFETPALLQRHKREGHRSAGAWMSSAADERGMTSAAAARGTQEGPHRCERINPSTGKPCNTVFSRPYDLTRHEDTIHNARKQKVRCHLCTEDKSFSRNDALTRHFRVCHPDHVDPSRKRRAGR